MDSLHYLVLSATILVILVYQFTANRRTQHRKPPPSPPSIPLIGHLFLLYTPIEQAANNLSKRYGPIFILRLGWRSTVVLSSAAAIEQCFADNDVIFSNRPRLPSRKVFEYNHSTFGAPYGHHWRAIRRCFVTKVLSEKSLQKSIKVRTEEIKFMMKQLYTLSSRGIRKVDARVLFYSLSFNIVAKTVVGKRWFVDEEIDSEETKRKVYDLVEMFSPLVPMALGDYFPFMRWLSFYGVERKQVKTHKRKDQFIQALLDTHQKSPPVQTVTTYIDVLFGLQESEPEYFTTDEIKGAIQVMFIAGSHSTTNTMELVVSQLISHPSVFNRARDEIDNHVGKLRLIRDTDVAKLVYLEGVINESLRLDSGDFLPQRVASEECVVGGYHIPKGTELLVSLRGVHRDPQLWTEPDMFKPERFTEETVKTKFMSFGLGRRACPGEGMGKRVVALCVGMLIQCFDWEDNSMNKDFLQIVFRPRKTLLPVLAQL